MNVRAPSPPYRQNTEISPTKCAFIYNAGGIGDYIMWTTAISYAIETFRHLHGYVMAPPYFVDLARLWLKPYALRFEVIESRGGELGDDERIATLPCFVPNNEQYCNANAWHLFDLGFIYYCQMNVRDIPKEWVRLPQIRGNETSLKHLSLPKDFAVVAVSATAENRRLSGETIEGISRHLVSRGITPVFLGKYDITTNYKGKSAEFDSSLGIDLREKTSLIEAAVIMARARVTVGLDGGLLHLASCSDAPVIFGFTSVDPKLRVPPRAPHARTAVVVPPEDLPCRFCNSRMLFITGHDFAQCLYKDNVCVSALTAEVFASAIDRILAPPSAPAEERAA